MRVGTLGEWRFAECLPDRRLRARGDAGSGPLHFGEIRWSAPCAWGRWVMIRRSAPSASVGFVCVGTLGSRAVMPGVAGGGSVCAGTLVGGRFFEAF